MENFNNLSANMQTIIKSCVRNAVEFCDDMLIDHDEVETTSLDKFRANVNIQAQNFMEWELDPENGNVTLPNVMIMAISEAVINFTKIEFTFKD